MDAIKSVDKLKIKAYRLRRFVKQSLEKDSSGKEAKPILIRFVQSNILSDSEDDSIKVSRLKSFTLNKYLELFARESGYDSWLSLSKSIRANEAIEEGVDAELYIPGVSEFNFNIWCSTYEDAKELLDAHKGYYLLQYKGSFFLAQAPHIEGLGLSPTDRDWGNIGWDWAKPKDPEAKVRLQKKLRQAREKLS